MIALALSLALVAVLAFTAWRLTARWVVRSIDWTGPLTLGPPTPLEIISRACADIVKVINRAIGTYAEALHRAADVFTSARHPGGQEQ